MPTPSSFSAVHYSLMEHLGVGARTGVSTDIQPLKDHYREILGRRTLDCGMPYTLDRHIGRGRQGVVFKGCRQGAKRCRTYHAIKVFDPGIYPSSQSYWEDMESISLQVTDLHRNRCPNLVNCDLYEEVNGVGFVQMELVDGVNLGQLLGHYRIFRRHHLHADEHFKTLFNTFKGRVCIQPGVVVYILRQMLFGLETLHAAKYLHCDIKPSNVMVDLQGYMRVIDFGRAHHVESGSSRLMATPAYAAPEFHLHRVQSIQSDLYGVGLVGLELLVGRPLLDPGAPFHPDRALDRKLHLLDGLEDLLPPYVRCNPELVQIIRRFLDPDPMKRFADALNAESSAEGLAQVHKQLTRMDIDSDYRRDLGSFVRRIIPNNGNLPPEVD